MGCRERERPRLETTQRHPSDVLGRENPIAVDEALERQIPRGVGASRTPRAGVDEAETWTRHERLGHLGAADPERDLELGQRKKSRVPDCGRRVVPYIDSPQILETRNVGAEATREPTVVEREHLEGLDRIDLGPELAHLLPRKAQRADRQVRQGATETRRHLVA